jgi:glucosamine-6-phosphate deaminase
VKYFKSIEHVHQSLIGQENLGLQGELLSTKRVQRSDKFQRELMVRKLMSDELDHHDEDSDFEPLNASPQPNKKRRTTTHDSP